MKKILFIILCLFILTGCSNKDENELVLVTEAGFAPYEYYDGDEIVGVDIDIAKEIAKELGKKLVVRDVYFDSIINEINSGKADIAAAGMSITPDRLKQVDFSMEYATSKQILVVKDESNMKISDINGKKVAVQLGSVADVALSDTSSGEYKNITLIRQKKFLSGLLDVKNGNADCLVMDELPAKELVNNNKGVKILDGYLFVDSYGMAVKKGNTELLETVNKVLQRLNDEGKIDEFTLNHSK